MILEYFNAEDFEKDLGQFLNYDTTIQRNISVIKRLVKVRENK